MSATVPIRTYPSLGDEFLQNSPTWEISQLFPTPPWFSAPASRRPIQRPSQPRWQSTQKELVWRVSATTGRPQRPAPGVAPRASTVQLKHFSRRIVLNVFQNYQNSSLVVRLNMSKDSKNSSTSSLRPGVNIPKDVEKPWFLV